MDQLPIKNEDQNASISVDIYGVKVATADSKSAGAEDCAYRSLEAEKNETLETLTCQIYDGDDEDDDGEKEDGHMPQALLRICNKFPQKIKNKRWSITCLMFERLYLNLDPNRKTKHLALQRMPKFKISTHWIYE